MRSFAALLLGLAGALVMPAQSCNEEEYHQSESFEWRPALSQSFQFLTMEHAVRMTQVKTRRNFRGPFVRDWRDSVAGTSGWGDGDGVLANYFGHPAQGAITGYIQIQNDPAGRYQEFSSSGRYWVSRAKAFTWAAAYSTQFELGPISEASLGNVGLRKGTMGYVDLVMTPVGGAGWIIAEDALDHYVVKKLERRFSGRNGQRFVRIALNPMRSFANLLRGTPPWYRDTRGYTNLGGN